MMGFNRRVFKELDKEKRSCCCCKLIIAKKIFCYRNVERNIVDRKT